MSLYSEKIEALIDAALADGVLTEKEKQILFKKAQAEGIDLDEFEMVLDAKLVELKKQSQSEEKKAAPKSDKFGDVRKCPACGALIPAMAASCPECGYEFSGIQASSSAQRLAKMIAQIQESATNQQNSMVRGANDKGLYTAYDDRKKTISDNSKKEILSLIEHFPVPNSKADIFDFLTALKPKIEVRSGDGLLDRDDYNLRKAYFVKYQECLEKAQVLFSSDQRINYFIESLPILKKTMKRSNPSFILGLIGGGVWVILLLVVIIGALFS